MPPRERDPCKTMHHFVLDKDVIPAALFTDYIYPKLPWFISKKVLPILPVKEELMPSAENLFDIVRDQLNPKMQGGN